jgi:hypothetical protein
MAKHFTISLLLLLFMATLKAQDKGGDAGNKQVLLYLHTDKNLYTNNEEIWFSAYLLNSGSEGIDQHKFLLVSLAREDDNKIILYSKFILQDGVGNGNLHLPDTIAPGNYKLVAYTNLVNKQNTPLDVFTQHLVVRSVDAEAITANMMLTDTLADSNGNYHIHLFALPKRIDKKLKPLVTYHLSGDSSKVVKQDMLGKYEIIVPANKVPQHNPVLYANVNYGNEFKYLSIKLPVQFQELTVRFFPEGGNITAGMANVVGIETKVGATPVSTYVILLKNNLPIDTIHTNYSGIAKFRLYQDGNSKHTLRWLNKKGAGVVFDMPAAVNSQLVLTTANAVCNDTLRFKIMAVKAHRVHIIICDKKEEYFSFDHELNVINNSFAVDLQRMPKGAGTVTILDSLNRPVAERLFFAHYNRQILAEIKTDKREYAKREEVKLTIALKDGLTGKPVSGLVSVACVQGNRLDISRQKDIESYAYLFHELDNSDINTGLANFKNKEWLENILLVRGWRRYTWQDSLATQDTIVRSLKFIGTVSRFDKPLKKALVVNIINEANLDSLGTGPTGNFMLSPELIFAPYDKRPIVFALSNNRNGLSTKLNDPYEELTKSVVKLTPAILPIDFQAASSSDYLTTDLNNTRKLKQVDIRANRDGSIYGTTKAGKNFCGDWVCFNKVLNCINHPEGTQPVIGEIYNMFNGFVASRHTYTGCIREGLGKTSNGGIRIEGIYAGKEFYGLTKADTEFNITQYISTVSWKPMLIIDDTGTTSYSFYNSDVTGQFKIVLQGISSDALISGMQTYEVKAK